MTVWAGYYVRDPQKPAAPSLADDLARVLSREPTDTPRIERLGRAALVYVDTSVLGTSPVRTDTLSTTLVAGEPLLSDVGTDRCGDHITFLHEAWARGEFSAAARSAGTFAAAHYDQRTSTLSLIADKLAVRPIYYAVTDTVVYFAGALRILEALPSLRKVMDVRGAVETMALGYPLADRTPYHDIFSIRDAQIVTFRDTAVHRARYWNIAAIPEQRDPISEVAERAHAHFSRAIDRRLCGDRRAVAFLSGGLDSRCMVAELVTRGVELHTFNFANEGTKDQILGDAFAKIAGTLHSRVPRPTDPVRWSMVMADVWRRSPHRAALPVDRPGLMWSGDGGSVGLGFVGVYDSVIAMLRAGRRDDAVTQYFAEHGISVPTRVFQREVAAELRDLVRQGVREALDEVQSDGDPGRELYFFRMAHDQRRHLASHFEDIDLHRLEFHLPFYDAELIAEVAAAPVDFGVGHRLYHAALRFFPNIVERVAWQTYPGHESCPIPLPPTAIDQWGRRQQEIVRRKRRSSILGETASVLFSESFPRPLLDRRYLIAATLGHWLGLGDYSYAVDYAKAFTELWGVSAGRWKLVAGPSGTG